ncbi:uncharacterized protein AMSG_04863, partial [Thecamonas trahens ATCC 50062]
MSGRRSAGRSGGRSNGGGLGGSGGGGGGGGRRARGRGGRSGKGGGVGGGGDGGGGGGGGGGSLEELDDGTTPLEEIRARFSPAQMKEVRSIFALLAGDDGTIGNNDLMAAMVDVGTDPSEAEVSDLILYASSTENMSGRLTFDDFLRCMAGLYFDDSFEAGTL